MRPNDRGLIVVAKANVKAAKRDLEENDEVFVNFAMFNISQAVEKTIKFLCACQDIPYDFSHFVGRLADKLIEANVIIPELILNSIPEYSTWATRSRYTADQMAQRSYVQKHLSKVENWITKIENKFGISKK
ncbi:MAG: HEPN domain-containing protein [Oscillospiraceae bacterium]|nr:HEPN domain-containing protein [Oscillospiraceae bacterium]